MKTTLKKREAENKIQEYEYGWICLVTIKYYTGKISRSQRHNNIKGKHYGT